MIAYTTPSCAAAYSGLCAISHVSMWAKDMKRIVFFSSFRFVYLEYLLNVSGHLKVSSECFFLVSINNNVRNEIIHTEFQ